MPNKELVTIRDLAKVVLKTGVYFRLSAHHIDIKGEDTASIEVWSVWDDGAGEGDMPLSEYRLNLDTPIADIGSLLFEIVTAEDTVAF